MSYKNQAARYNLYSRCGVVIVLKVVCKLIITINSTTTWASQKPLQRNIAREEGRKTHYLPRIMYHPPQTTELRRCIPILFYFFTLLIFYTDLYYLLTDGFDPDAFLAQLAAPPKCAVHKQVDLKKNKTREGWEYFHCDVSESYTPCFMSCGVKDADVYLKKAALDLAPCYKDNLPDVRCFCNKGLILKQSRSERNPNRLFLSCRQKEKCSFFQWADEEPWRPEIKEVLRIDA